jgi:hypothetical protein
MDAFKLGVVAYGQKQPWASVIEPDSNGPDKLIKVKFFESVPTRLADVVADGVDNLRSALDQIGYVVADLAGKPNAKSAYFPVAEDAAGLEIVLKGRCKDLPKEIRDLFAAMLPYKGGNNLLWGLNKLCNANKHRILTPMGAGGAGMTLGGSRPGQYARGPIEWYSEPKFIRSKNELIFGRIGPGGELRMDGQLSFFIGLGDLDFLRRAPALDLVDAFVEEVECVLMVTEAECRRIGLLPS